MNLPGFESIQGLTQDVLDRADDFLQFISGMPRKSADIEKHFGWCGSSVRGLSNHLRRNGIPVCADTRGYFLGTCMSDIDKQIESLRGRIRSLELAIDGLTSRRNVMLYGDVGQTTLELEVE